MRNQFTVGYYIKKFRAIPPRKWTTRRFFDDMGLRYCALGHCGADGMRATPESRALGLLFRAHALPAVADVNDGNLCASLGFKQKTPRGRILAALRHIQNNTVPRKIA